jgi:DNA modification methylase
VTQFMQQNTKTAKNIKASFLEGELNKIHMGDARELSKRLQNESVAVTITSPPYFDLKDYGTKNQIGFGQDYKQYLTDLCGVFSEVRRATKSNGSLWVVIDTFRRDQEVWPLPFDLASKLTADGWSLRDIIIWKKDRTLPWTHEGTTKKIFEYILVFAKKGQSFRYDADDFRDPIQLKRWWVQYPERYNPKGKALEEIWNFDIPTQGSWGSKHLSHFCPLPSGLVGRIIKLATAEGDLVLDPFAGTGTVPSQAIFSKRSYLGFELNKKYIAMFHAYMKQSKKVSSIANLETRAQQSEFEQNILDLRTLKFARLLFLGAAGESGDFGVERVLTWRLDTLPTEKNKIVVSKFVFVLKRRGLVKRLKEKVMSLISTKPLSKFGIQADIGYVEIDKTIAGFQRDQVVFGYTATNSYSYAKRMLQEEALFSRYPVISTIGKNLEVPDD